ncbi:MAG: dihydroorotate dehydrogenase 2 [Chloroflexota bacterium]
MSLLRRLLSSPPLYRWLVRPWLFRLEPERAQRVADTVLAARPLWRALAPSPDSIAAPTELAGIPLRNSLGLAAGLDKRCAYLGSLGHLGFGYVVGGTVTRHPRPGNPRPRVLREVGRRSLINALGFPSEGLEAAVKHLAALDDRPARVLVSTAALEEAETEECLRALEPWVDGVELNISSPNTAGLRRFQEPVALRGLLGRLNAARTKPLFIKLPPYTDDAGRESVLSLARVCRESGVSGVTAINTMPVEDARLAMGRGGLSGAAITGHMLRIVPELRAEVGPGLAINACGGVGSAQDALAALAAGADTVQLYSAMVYEGPGLIVRIAQGIARERRGVNA